MARRLRKATHRPTIQVRPTYDRRTTHSAIRALDVLAYFDDIRRPATVGEVAHALNIPQSSTSLLLRSLAAAGYVNHEPLERTFYIAERTALLGHWIDPRLLRESSLIEAMRSLRDETSATIFLAVRNGCNAQYILVVEAEADGLLHLVAGTVRPLVASCAGYALMKNWCDQKIISATLRHNIESEGDSISPKQVLEAVEHVRNHGFAVSINLHSHGGLAVATPIPSFNGPESLVLGVGGVGDTSLERADNWAQKVAEKLRGL